MKLTFGFKNNSLAFISPRQFSPGKRHHRMEKLTELLESIKMLLATSAPLLELIE